MSGKITGLVVPLSLRSRIISHLPSNPYPKQVHFKFYNDDGGFNANTSLANEDTDYNITTALAMSFRLRIEVANTGGVAESITRRLEFKEDSGSWTEISTGFNNENIVLSDSNYFWDSDPTISKLSATGYFTNGQGKDISSETSQTALDSQFYLEDEYSLKLLPTSIGHVYQFRITNSGMPLDQYDVYPTISNNTNITTKITVPDLQKQDKTISDLQARIKDLLSQITSFQSQLSSMTDNSAKNLPPACLGVTFTRNLTLGSTGSDVKCLQSTLNSLGYTVASSGPGSPGNETDRFGLLTLAAVQRYQDEKFSYHANQFGPLSRADLSTWLLVGFNS